MEHESTVGARGAGSSAAAATQYAASPTLSRGSGARLFSIPGVGRFRASCARPGTARVSYVADDTSQSVTVETARATRPAVSIDPGERVAVTVDRRTAPRSDWQVAILSEGRIDVVTASVTVAQLAPGFGCFVSAKADRVRRTR
ncbi:MAG TPA: hypothetical protein VF072_15605 [Thermoleophilaceae bacterium]